MDRREKLTEAAKNFLLLSVSLLISLGVAEFLARVALDPADYLLATLSSDPVLNHRIASNSGGHDDWGFRNPRRPQNANIVAIGDSMTYGVSARMRESWPAALGEVRGTTVYNMGLGGYGPAQYLHLLQTRAVTLKPEVVVVGFYFGNDLLDVFNSVRFKPYWRNYGQVETGTDDAPPFVAQPSRGKFLRGLRDWLAHHSVLYAALSRSPVFDAVRRHESDDGQADRDRKVRYHDSNHDVILAFSQFLDLEDGRIRSAFAIAQRMFLEMNAFAEKSNIKLMVALIPTKVRVYSGLAERNGYFERHPAWANAVRQETAVHDAMTAFFKAHGISFVDLLPPLQRGVDRGDIYPPFDSHPNHVGYRIIAEAIHAQLGQIAGAKSGD